MISILPAAIDVSTIKLKTFLHDENFAWRYMLIEIFTHCKSLNNQSILKGDLLLHAFNLYFIKKKLIKLNTT